MDQRQTHQELYNYLNSLSEGDLLELFKVDCDEETFKETTKYKFIEGKGGKNLFINYFFDQLSENENKANDSVLIENCKRALKGFFDSVENDIKSI